ncbi:G-protein coupled receptor 1 [Branchiostoma belcheri]|nr:G-protein coupled receptor 1 [Branchiostoma belcheri]
MKTRPPGHSHGHRQPGDRSAPTGDARRRLDLDGGGDLWALQAPIQSNMSLVTRGCGSISWGVAFGAVPSQWCRPRSYQKQATENKTVVTLLIILGMFMVLWTPFIIVTFVRSFAPELVGPSTRAITVLMVFVNSAANPVVYSLRNTSFRAAARDFVCACGC